MRKRGRKSAAALAIVAIDAAAQRPQAPLRLTAEEKAVWREIVDRLRPDWIAGGAEFLLEIYVRAIVLERLLADQIRTMTVYNERFGDLVKLQRSEAALIGNLATKLRLTPRSSHDRTAPKLVPPGPRPWDIDSTRPERDEEFRGWGEIARPAALSEPDSEGS